MLMNKSIQKQTGFTLAEVMITMAIAGVLLAVGMPSMREFIQNGRITSVTNELVSTLMVARSEAMRQSTTTCVCPSTDGATCEPSSNWETGWIAFSDYNSNCIMDGVAPNADTMLKVWDGTDYAGQITVRNNNGLINALNRVSFNSRGETQSNVAGVGMGGTFSICDDRPFGAGYPGTVVNGKVVRRAAAVVLNVSGSARSTRQESQITYTAP
jgi:type IV fimbrial biogenesis protein FimT